MRPEFALATHELKPDFARAGIVKDAGDDPDVTHGALIVATVRLARPGAGLSFEAGEGVGTVTRPGLPLPVGEPAINPAPRAMIRANLGEVAARLGAGADAIVEISIPGGERIAKRTANGRLGIVGGLSILGTTGIVVPYSCSAWIHSIHRGVDVARASGCTHIGAATGETSEAAIRALYGLPDHALIEMGDFVGGLLKYLREHPVARLTIAGGPAKMTKLAEGKLDLHSKRGAVDLAALAERVADAGGSPTLAEAIASANSGLHAFELAQAAGFDLPALVADGAWATAAAVSSPDSRASLKRSSSAETGACSQAAVFGRFSKMVCMRGRVAGFIRARPVSGPHGIGGHSRRCRARSRGSPPPRARGRRE